MSYGRRITDRRRRVLYTAQNAKSYGSTPSSRQATERLRRARRPTAAYGSRVHRRLRGRWFSLVPVRRRTLIAVSATMLGFAIFLCLGHYLSVAWPFISDHPKLARPLRLDRPDSFGRWVSCMLLAGSAGTSLLIYQLRRYRTDDYEGHYRLWRTVLIVLVLASINSLTSTVGWAGAIVDAAVGKRVALAGGDWLRLLLTVGGSALMMRLVAEVRRSRWAVTTVLAATALLALPVAASWNLLATDSRKLWVLVTAAPLLAHTVLFLSLGIYLRMLYREVREIEDGESLTQRIDQLRHSWSQARLQRREEKEELRQQREEEKQKREEEKRRSQKERREAKEQAKRERATNSTEDEAEAAENASDERADSKPRPANSRVVDERRSADSDWSDQEEAEPAPARARRRWWSRRRQVAGEDAEQQETNDQTNESTTEEHREQDSSRNSNKGSLASRLTSCFRRGRRDGEGEDSEPSSRPPSPKAPGPKKKRRRFSLRLVPPGGDSEGESAEEDGVGGAEDSHEPQRKKSRFGFPWKRSSAADRGAEAATDDEASQATSNSRGPQVHPNGDRQGSLPEQEDTQLLDPEEIDWSSLSKSERRRLRKQLKRQNRAA